MASVDPRALPFLSLQDRKRFPEVACIYFVFDDMGVLQYIGRASNLRRRWISHHREQWAERVAWMETEDLDQIPIEKALIEVFRPLQNGPAYIPGKIAAADPTAVIHINVTVPVVVRDRIVTMAAADYRSVSNLTRRLIEQAAGRSLTEILQDATAP